MTMPVLGLDTSNYTTSAAVFDGADGCNAGPPAGGAARRAGTAAERRPVPACEAAPGAAGGAGGPRTAPGPEGSGGQHPAPGCGGLLHALLPGGGVPGKGAGRRLGVPFFACSHQQGHLAAAAWSAGRTDLLDGPFLAWHLSGGTTELLLVRPQGTNVAAEKLGGTSDISAGQLIDRTGVLLGLQFPAGKALDELYPQADACMEYRVKLKDLTFSLSGMENQVKRLLTEGEAPANVARFTLDTVCSVVLRATPGGPAPLPRPAGAVLRRCGLPTDSCGPPWRGAAAPLFAQPCYSTDNAMGVAILTRRALEGGELA